MFVSEFLDYVYIDRENTAQTRDNYLTFLRVFSSYLVQNSYLKERLTEGISVLGKRLYRKLQIAILDGDIICLYDYWGEEISCCCLWISDHDGLIINISGFYNNQLLLWYLDHIYNIVEAIDTIFCYMFLEKVTKYLLLPLKYRGHIGLRLFNNVSK